VTESSASMIMNPKLAHELREDYGSTAMRAPFSGLLFGFLLRFLTNQGCEFSVGTSRAFHRFISRSEFRHYGYSLIMRGPLPPDLLESWG